MMIKKAPKKYNPMAKALALGQYQPKITPNKKKVPYTRKNNKKISLDID